MFLKNFKILQQISRYAGTLGDYQSSFLVTGTNGTSYTVNPAYATAGFDFGSLPKQLWRSSNSTSSMLLSTYFTKKGRYANLYVGTSEKEVNENDYTMTIPSEMKFATQTPHTPNMYKDSDNMLHVVYSEFYENSASEVVLTEYGLVRSICNTTGTNQSDEAPILIFRELFEEPITVPANGTFSLSVDFIIGPSSV